jgi:hypothetical protein
MAGYAEIPYDVQLEGFPAHLPRQIAPFIDARLFAEIVGKANLAIKSGTYDLWQKIVLVGWLGIFATIVSSIYFVTFFLIAAVLPMIAILVAFWRYMRRSRLNKRRSLLVDKLGSESSRIRSMGVQAEFTLLETKQTVFTITNNHFSQNLLIDWTLIIEAGDPALQNMVMMPVIMSPTHHYAPQGQQYAQPPQYAQ